MHAALGDNLTVKVSVLFEEPGVLDDLRAAGACCHRVLIIDHGGTGLAGNTGVLTNLVIAAR